MNRRLTLGLLGIFILLGGYIYFFIDIEFDSNEDADSIWGEIYAPYDVVELEITTSQGYTHFVRTGDTPERDWQLITPTKITPDELDQVQVNGAATRLAILTIDQTLTDVSDLSPYGLLEPTITATLTLTNGQKLTLIGGADAPVNNQRYAQLPGDEQTVYVIFDFALDALQLIAASPPLAPTPFPTITPNP